MNARGPENARFRRRVRAAYRSTCMVCGVHFPPTELNRSPGVDAAHILPYCEYDLDEIFNGLCLCKLHHWAFDEDLIRIRYDDEERAYYAELREGVEERMAAINPGFSLEVLRRDLGRISQERLPADRNHWPKPELLRRHAQQP